MSTSPLSPTPRDASDALEALAVALALQAEIANTRPVNVVNSFGATTPLPGSHANRTLGYFSILSPGQTGLSPEELASLFSCDQSEQPAFSHRYFEVDAGGAPREGLALLSPLDAAALCKAARAMPFGVASCADGVRHLAIAENPRRQFAAFLDFEVSIAPDATEEEVLQAPGKGGAVRLTVTLRQLHTRASLRREGAAAALLEFVGDVVQAELETLMARLRPLASQAGQTLVVNLNVETACDSQAAYMVQGLLEDALANCMLGVTDQTDALADFESAIVN